ncbi:MAG TPA: cellulase family glycosylhydrolase [Treponema sp.]|nr:cellulase family glycosylhydrolase [Treponema sp.]
MKRIVRIPAAFFTLCIFIVGLGLCSPLFGETGEPAFFENLSTVRPSDGGALSVKSSDGRRQLCDSHGQPVQLRGMSTHGLQWYPQILNDNAFRTLSQDWGSNVIRLAMYVTERGYSVNPEIRDRVVEGIKLAIKHDMYVIVDWHVLTPGNPSAPEYAGAMDFFKGIAAEFPNNPSIIYELCNEPNDNAPGVSNDEDGWAMVKEYAEPIIAMLRKGGNENCIIVGNPNWCQRPDLCIENPILDTNTLYAFHFYSGTHKENEYVWSKIQTAFDAGLPLFCSEWGTSSASGDGGPFFDEANAWISFMNRNKISWCNWSLTNKNEVSGVFLPYQNGISEPTSLDPGTAAVWPLESLSLSGEYARARIKGIAYRPIIRAEPEPVEHDEEGYPEIPSDFEDSTRQGWDWFASSGVQSRLSIEKIRGSSALSWYTEYSESKLQDAWGDAPRLICQNAIIYREKSRYLTFDLYLEPKRVTKGKLSIVLALAPPSLGYWAQAAKNVEVTFTGKKAAKIGSDGLYHVRAVFDLKDLRDDKKLGPDDEIRDVTIIIVNDESDFSGKMYLDNVQLSLKRK